jgi:hypothetical protein
VILIGRFIKAHTVGSRGGAHPTPGLIFCVEVQTAHQVVRIIVKIAELIGRRLLERCYISNIQHSNTLDTLRYVSKLTLLRRPTEHARERRTVSPDTLHPGILVLPSFEPGDTLRVFRLHVLDARHVGLQAPAVVVGGIRGEGLGLRIHWLDGHIRGEGCFAGYGRSRLLDMSSDLLGLGGYA